MESIMRDTSDGKYTSYTIYILNIQHRQSQYSLTIQYTQSTCAVCRPTDGMHPE